MTTYITYAGAYDPTIHRVLECTPGNRSVTYFPADHPAMELPASDWLITYRYRNIIPPSVLNNVGDSVNLHPSYLPWNRGAHPDFWAWHDDTPHGVTAHRLAYGTDTGAIWERNLVQLNPGLSLTRNYDVLHHFLIAMFVTIWPDVFAGKLEPLPQAGSGSYHRVADLPIPADGWSVPSQSVRGLYNAVR